MSKSQRSSGYGQRAAEKNLTIEEKLKRAFRTADVDGSRSVSKRELYRAMQLGLAKKEARADELRTC